MDMNVNTAAFPEASSALRKRAWVIGRMTEMLVLKIRNAESEFDDVNYKRTLEALGRLQRGISCFENQVDGMEKDLRRLENIVNQYMSGGYEGYGV